MVLLTFSVLLQEFGITSRWQYYFWNLVLLSFFVVPPEECKEQSHLPSDEWLDICEQNDCVCEHPPEPANIFTRMPPVTDAIKVLVHLPPPASVWIYSGSLSRIHHSLLRYHTVSRRVYRLRGIDYRHDSYTILPQQPQIGLWLILSCDLERWTLWYQQCDARHAPGRLPIVWSRSG